MYQLKFMSKNFKTLVSKIHKLSASEQQEILQKEFELWKGGLEQIDDICVAGFKIL
jgi:hypothetical protein